MTPRVCSQNEGRGQETAVKERKREYDGRDTKHHENIDAADESIERLSLFDHSNGRGEIPNRTSGICSHDKVRSQVATFEEGEWENRRGENTDTSIYWESHPHSCAGRGSPGGCGH